MNKTLEALKVWKGIQWALKDVAYGGKEIIEKSLKALEIIKQYPFEVASVVSQPTYEDYCRWFTSLKDGKPILTKEKYDLLKEVLL